MPRPTKAINAKKTSQGTSLTQTKRESALTAAGAQLQCSSGGGGGGCTGCEPNVPYVTTLIEFVSILESLKSSIDKYYSPSRVTAPFSAEINARGTINPRLAARLEWIKRYKDTEGRFDTTNPTHIEQLKEQFRRIGFSWEIDTWLREWKPTPPPVAGGNTATGAPGAPTRSAVPAH